MTYVRQKIATAAGTGTNVVGVAPCPAGRRPTGGGVDSPNGDLTVRESRPDPADSAATAWHVRAQVHSATTDVYAYAVCVNATSVATVSGP